MFSVRASGEGVVVVDVAVTRSELENRFVRFVAANRERARRLAWRLAGGNDATAEDITQEAFLKAYKGLARFRSQASLETWFYRILVRQAQSHARWRRVREVWSHHANDAIDTMSTGDAGSCERADMRAPRDPLLERRIARALSRLTVAQRHAFVLVHLEGFSVHQAAAVMCKPDGTVKSHLHRALQGLRRELADLAGEVTG